MNVSVYGNISRAAWFYWIRRVKKSFNLIFIQSISVCNIMWKCYDRENIRNWISFLHNICVTQRHASVTNKLTLRAFVPDRLAAESTLLLSECRVQMIEHSDIHQIFTLLGENRVFPTLSVEKGTKSNEIYRKHD